MRFGRARPVVTLLSLLAVALGAIAVPTPVQATPGGTLTVEFHANGENLTLPTTNGRTHFWGTATGVGQLTGTSTKGRLTTAEFTHLAMPFSGWLDYSQPGEPLCPLLGSAGTGDKGHITVGSNPLPGTTGITYSSGHGNTGVITGVTYSFDVTYQRVGPAASLLFGAPFGTAYATVYFTTPGWGDDWFTVPASAVGQAAFVTDYAQATRNCDAGGGPTLNYSLTGVVNGAATG